MISSRCNHNVDSVKSMSIRNRRDVIVVSIRCHHDLSNWHRNGVVVSRHWNDAVTANLTISILFIVMISWWSSFNIYTNWYCILFFCCMNATNVPGYRGGIEGMNFFCKKSIRIKTFSCDLSNKIWGRDFFFEW
jgi:hypothetical protein